MKRFVRCNQLIKTLFRRPQSFITKIECAPVVRLQNKETDCHRRVGFFKQLMFAGKKFIKINEVAQTLAHLLPVDGYHIIMHPVFHRRFAAGAF